MVDLTAHEAMCNWRIGIEEGDPKIPYHERTVTIKLVSEGTIETRVVSARTGRELSYEELEREEITFEPVTFTEIIYEDFRLIIMGQN